VIEPEQRTPAADAGRAQVVERRAPFDDDIDVLDAVEEFLRDGGDGLPDEAAKLSPLHG
jgi:hypothetical protein